MNAGNISIAIGYVDDDIIEAVDNLRSRKKTNSHWTRWTALAACLCLIVGAAVFYLQGFPLLGAKCGGSLGTLVEGSYYYSADFAFYRYIASENKREYLMSRFNVFDISFLVDEYGLYYVKGRSLYVRENETGKSRVLYTADMETTTHIGFTNLTDGQINVSLFDKNSMDTEHWRVIRLDAKTGETVWQGTLTFAEYNALSISGEKENDTLTVAPYGIYLTATDDYIIFIGFDSPAYPKSQILFSYDRKSGETTLLYDGDDMGSAYNAVTDGNWLFTNAPWNGGRTDCWKMIYDDNGRLTGLELWATDI